MYGMAQTIPDRSIITDLTNAFLDGIYKTWRMMSVLKLFMIYNSLLKVE